jgi:hypothetical protein
MPLDPPHNYQEDWERMQEDDVFNEISIKYHLSTIPPGIPTWFLARSHRFTTYTHWRSGAVFADNPTRRHLALVKTFPHDRYITLTVRGPQPHNFMALLRDGLELTLRRFPGLRVERLIPCSGHNGDLCPHEFRLSNLEKAIERSQPVFEIQCSHSFQMVSVPRLLFGLHWSAHSQIFEQLQEIKTLSSSKHEELLALLQREFAKSFRREQSKIESHCPNVFTLRRCNYTVRRLVAGILLEKGGDI